MTRRCLQKCNPVGTSAVRQDDCPSELHHIQLLFSRREPPLLPVQKADAERYHLHSCHRLQAILCDILLYSAYDRVRYVLIEVKSEYFCAPHLISFVAVKTCVTVNRISLKKCCTSARSASGRVSVPSVSPPANVVDYTPCHW